MIEPVLLYIFKVILAMLPFAGTILLAYVAHYFWMHYIRQDFISGIDFCVLEIIPPREVLRSPKAMELFITNALYHFSVKGGKEQYWQGAVWFWFSLEIASIDGQVHFYIRTPTRLKGLIETQMYAQYPQAQVREVEDYTLGVDEITPQSSWMGWGCEFALAKPSAFPLKTYVDFGLDKDPKEEFKVDPITPVIELLGSIQKGEQVWLQIVITPSKKKFHTPGTWFGHHDWVKESIVQLMKTMRPYSTTRESVDEPGHYGLEVRTPGFLKNVEDKISSKITKLGFDTGIRLMYVAKKEVYSMNTRRNIRLIFRQYANPDLNELSRLNATQGDAYGGLFPTSPDVILKITDRMLTEYRERSFFHSPMRHTLLAHGKPLIWPLSPYLFPGYRHSHTFVLNTEELATLWHFPGQMLKVPTLERIESKEASPPTNLPT